MGLFSRKSEATTAPEAAAPPAKLKKGAPGPPTLEALNRKVDALSRKYEAAEAANALALVVISDMFRDSTSGPLASRLETAAQAVEFEAASPGIQALLGRLKEARSADGERQRRRASGQLQVFRGAGGRNY
jgi:hypothetical protein